MGEKFSGARQGVRYRGNDGQGALLLGKSTPEEDAGQMVLPGIDSTTVRYKVGDKEHSYETDRSRVHPDSVEWGHTTKQRAHDPVEWNGQLTMRGMPRPTDVHLARLRQQNPALNDYQFKGDRDEPRSMQVFSKETGHRVGYMQLDYKRDDWQEHPGHREVGSIGVAAAHAGKGIGEAMYDLARLRGTKIVHSSHRSESGESFARRVGGPQFARKQGIGDDEYRGLDHDPEKI